MTKPHRSRSAAAVLALTFGLAACGGSPTAGTGPATSTINDTATPALAQIEAQLQGLGPEERRAELIRLATAEGGEVSFYGSTNPEDVDPVMEAFEDQTGIAVNNYRASADSVLQRVQEEARAGYSGADVIINGAAEFQQVEPLGLLAKFTTPIAEQIHEGGVREDGIDVYRVLCISMWNTDRLTPDQYPKTWEDILEDHPGELVLDPTDWDWFATFTQAYLMGEKGMTEEEAIAYWKEVAKNAVVISGHTLGTQLVTTGEYSITAVTYQHGLPPEGAPVEWQPPIWPVVEQSTIISILSTTTKPASALLLTEFFLTDGQTILYEGGRSPANVTAPSSWPVEYNDLTVPIDPALFTDEAQAKKWQDYYDEVIANAGQG